MYVALIHSVIPKLAKTQGVVHEHFCSDVNTFGDNIPEEIERLYKTAECFFFNEPTKAEKTFMEKM